MTDHGRTLRPAAVRSYYDHFGAKQDSQGFYEEPALDDLVAHAGFSGAAHVFEFGCGTGRFAARLLADHLPAAATYRGCDLSPVMVGLAERRLAGFGDRARVVPAPGGVGFPLDDGEVDRVVATYVLDLLAEADIAGFFAEAHRVLAPGGRVAVASLTRGVGVPSRIVAALWTGLFRLRPSLVGGCRPVDPMAFIDPAAWRTVHRGVVTPFAVPSEVLVLEATGARGEVGS